MRWLAVAVFTVAVACPGMAAASPASWSSQSAHTIDSGRVEVGLFSESRWGVSNRFELSTHPLWLLVLPQLQGKYHWWQQDNLLFSTRHRLAYPSLFLDWAAKEGSLGLLPADTDVPQALLLSNQAVFSIDFEAHALTAFAGGVVAPRTAAQLPVLDFPFLYQRFAALYGLAVPEAGLALEGPLSESLGYALEAGAVWFSLEPDETGGLSQAWAFEQALRLDYFPSFDWRISALLRQAQAQFPIGWRMHVLPMLDVRTAF